MSLWWTMAHVNIPDISAGRAISLSDSMFSWYSSYGTIMVLESSHLLLCGDCSFLFTIPVTTRYFLSSSVGKESGCNAGDPGSISGLESTLEKEMTTRKRNWLQMTALLRVIQLLDHSWLRIRLRGGRPGFDPCFGMIPWGRKWWPTPVLLPGESHGRRSLVHGVYKELDTTERFHFHFFYFQAEETIKPCLDSWSTENVRK